MLCLKPWYKICFVFSLRGDIRCRDYDVKACFASLLLRVDPFLNSSGKEIFGTAGGKLPQRAEGYPRGRRCGRNGRRKGGPGGQTQGRALLIASHIISSPVVSSYLISSHLSCFPYPVSIASGVFNEINVGSGHASLTGVTPVPRYRMDDVFEKSLVYRLRLLF